jgi:hypothetical protein
MPTSLAACARLLAKLGLRHHVDADDGVIRLVFVTRGYKNLRGEYLAVVGLETPDDGRRVRACICRAFAPGADPARTCLALCRLAAEIPLVAVEFDADQGDLRLVVETAVEDGTLSASQVAAMVDRLVEAAEAWAPLVASLCGQPPVGSSVTNQKRGAA